jgi:putative salt-induced outer membrane protein YdiY
MQFRGLKIIRIFVMKYIIILFVAAFFTECCLGTTPAQCGPTNSVAAKTPPPAWTGTITAGLTATDGNVNSVLTAEKLAAERKSASDDLTLGADSTYGVANSVKTAESLHGCAQDNHLFIDNTWYAYGREDALHDAIADVDYRVTTSAGAGYYFLKDKVNTLSTEAGPALENEHLDDQYHNYPSARVAEKFEHKIDGHARVWENVEVIPPLTYLDAFLVNTEVGVETPLTHRLSLQTCLQDNFANVPAPGYKNNDLKLISGLVFKF